MVKRKEIMRFLGKLMALEKNMLAEKTQIHKKQIVYVFLFYADVSF